MKKLIILFTALVLSVIQVNGQRTFYFTVSMPDSLVAFAGNDQYVAPGNSGTLGGTPAVTGGSAPYTYLWTPGIFLNDSTIANPHVTPMFDQTYLFTVRDGNNCVAGDEVVVTTDSSSISSDLIYGSSKAPLVYYSSIGQKIIVDFGQLRLKSGNAALEVLDLYARVMHSRSADLAESNRIEITAGFPSQVLIVVVRFAGQSWNYKLFIK